MTDPIREAPLASDRTLRHARTPATTLAPSQALFEEQCLGLGPSEPKARRFGVSRVERGEGALQKPPKKTLDPKQRGALDLALAWVRSDASSFVRYRRRWALTLLASLLVSAAPTASAREVNQTSKAGAEALFQDALRLMKAGQFPDACPKLARSQELDPAVGTLLYLAECYERIGKPAQAWATYRSAESAALHAGQTKRVEIAKGRADALEPTLPRLVIEVPPEHRVHGLALSFDGTPLAKASWGIALPVDPGEHRVDARAPKRESWSTTLTAEGGSHTVRVPMLVEIDSTGPVSRVSTSPIAGARANADTSAGAGGTQRTLGYVAGGVGVVGLAAGAVFGLRARSKQDDAKAYCLPDDSSRCYPRGVALNDEAKSAATLSNVGFVTGGAALFGGVLLVLLAPSDEPQTSGIRAQASVAQESVGLMLEGTW